MIIMLIIIIIRMIRMIMVIIIIIRMIKRLLSHHHLLSLINDIMKLTNYQGGMCFHAVMVVVIVMVFWMILIIGVSKELTESQIAASGNHLQRWSASNQISTHFAHRLYTLHTNTLKMAHCMLDNEN